MNWTLRKVETLVLSALNFQLMFENEVLQKHRKIFPYRPLSHPPRYQATF